MEDTRARVRGPAIYIEDAHYDRLHALAMAFLDRMPEPARLLREEIERAEILEEARPATPVVTMGAEVTYRDETAKRRETVRLVYPNEADIAERKISVLTPVGAALIGMPEGGSIAWEGRGGEERRITVLKVKARTRRAG
jgi:regulator of nucleoside diphosphate kinase